MAAFPVVKPAVEGGVRERGLDALGFEFGAGQADGLGHPPLARNEDVAQQGVGVDLLQVEMRAAPVEAAPVGQVGAVVAVLAHFD